MNTKNNQRYQEMAERMESAMLKLMEKTDPEKITVKKICEAAEVNRSTFYAHYLDIYDMIERMEDNMQEALRREYAGAEALLFMPGSSMLPFLRHIRKNVFFYRAALKTRRDFPLKQGRENMWEMVIRPRCEAAGITSEEEMLYYFISYQSGYTHVLRHWVDGGCKEPEEVIAKILDNTIPMIWGGN